MHSFVLCPVAPIPRLRGPLIVIGLLQHTVRGAALEDY